MSRSTFELRVRLAPINMFSPQVFLLTVPSVASVMNPFFVIYVSRLSLLYCLSVPCSFLITCWERTDLLALLLCDVPLCFVIVPLYGVSGKVWYLIVLIPDIVLLLYFYCKSYIKEYI